MGQREAIIFESLLCDGLALRVWERVSARFLCSHAKNPRHSHLRTLSCHEHSQRVSVSPSSPLCQRATKLTVAFTARALPASVCARLAGQDKHAILHQVRVVCLHVRLRVRAEWLGVIVKAFLM